MANIQQIVRSGKIDRRQTKTETVFGMHRRRMFWDAVPPKSRLRACARASHTVMSGDLIADPVLRAVGDRHEIMRAAV